MSQITTLNDILLKGVNEEEKKKTTPKRVRFNIGGESSPSQTPKRGRTKKTMEEKEETPLVVNENIDSLFQSNTIVEEPIKEPIKHLEPKEYDIYAFKKEEETEILGVEKRSLLFKINQYKDLFKKELKDFKIKQNATISELENYLKECEIIVNINSVEGFIIDSILNCIIIIEKSLKNRSRYDISGTADILQKNEQFNKLCKQLMIKYKIFSAVPPEYQLIFIISTTAMIQMKKNRTNNLDQPVQEDNDIQE